MVLALGRLQAYGWHCDKHHSIPLCPLYDSRGDQLVAFPGFHALPGSDQTVTILCGKSKVLCWNTYKKTHKQVLEAFASLGSSMHFEDDMVMKLELYICAISMPSNYGKCDGSCSTRSNMQMRNCHQQANYITLVCSARH